LFDNIFDIILSLLSEDKINKLVARTGKITTRPGKIAF
jgi:hypothetical protein